MAYVPPKYPEAIPSEAELFPWVDDEHYVSIAKFEAIIKELRAALVELGTDPAGDSDTVKLRLEQIEGSLIPAGLISMWSGTIANIPTGWALCDGQDGRPNLLDKFVVGVPNAQTDPGDTGGASQHKHTQPAHGHAYSGNTGYYNWNVRREGDAWDSGGTGTHRHSYSGTSQNGGDQDTSEVAHLPPYYKVAYIIKT